MRRCSLELCLPRAVLRPIAIRAGPLSPPPVLPTSTDQRLTLAESTGYRIKRRLLGPPLHTEQLEHETLGKPTALAVFASDNLSSSAYATEEILRVLVPVDRRRRVLAGRADHVALLVVLGFLILSYRQTIKAYPTAGGAYIVTRDNFGLLPAQVAGVALLTDYILTVAVSVAAGTAALASAFPSLAPYSAADRDRVRRRSSPSATCAASKESGKIFAVPTYFFIVNMVVLLGVGVVPAGVTGDLPPARRPTAGHGARSAPAGDGLLMGAALFVVLHAFASGGAAVTGVEAISNGVPAFQKPEWKNARDDPGDHGLAARRDVPRPVGPGGQDARDAVRRAARRR